MEKPHGVRQSEARSILDTPRRSRDPGLRAIEFLAEGESTHAKTKQRYRGGFGSGSTRINNGPRGAVAYLGRTTTRGPPRSPVVESFVAGLAWARVPAASRSRARGEPGSGVPRVGAASASILGRIARRGSPRSLASSIKSLASSARLLLAIVPSRTAPRPSRPLVQFEPLVAGVAWARAVGSEEPRARRSRSRARRTRPTPSSIAGRRPRCGARRRRCVTQADRRVIIQLKASRFWTTIACGRSCK